MSAKLKITTSIVGLDLLQKRIQFVKSLIEIEKNLALQQWFQEKCLEEVDKTSKELLKGGTTNDEEIQDYLKNNKLRIDKDKNGFVIYNDTYILYDNPNYKGKFSIALAFEYGTGIVGENAPKDNHWEYNVNKHNWAWTYWKNGKKYSTYGYEGFEIYRNARIRIENKMNDWVKDYLKGKR